MIASLNSMAGRVFVLLLLGIVGSAFLTLHANAAAHGIPTMRPYVLPVVFAVSVLAVAYGVARMSTRPLRELGSAAIRLGRDIDAKPLPERGPTEVRDAAIAFNAMQTRIQRDVRERTSMLAAITHDLQTPVTRLRLRLEKVHDEELRARLIDDLAMMRETIAEGLDLARSLEPDGPLQRVDLDSLLDSVCADAQDAGHDVTLTGCTHAPVRGAPNALRRCIMNLLDNAIAYGRFARVESVAESGNAVVRIRDGGPGIPPEHLRAVFDPFYRVEGSRSRDTGGTGVGLTIARNVAERYGGTIALCNHPDGGLEVTLELPVATG